MATFSVCDRCQVLERAQKRQSDMDDKISEGGGNVYPGARRWSVMTGEAAARIREQQAKQAQAQPTTT